MLKFAITSGGIVSGSGDGAAEQLAAQCAALARSGVDFLLVREKMIDAGQLAEVSRKVVAAVREARPATRILVAGRLDVTVAVAADGVHLSARVGELTVSQTRQLMPHAFVSVSCHSLEEIERARDGGASAALFGPVFGKMIDGVEIVAGVGSERLREACIAAGAMPVFALGGVTEANAAQCVEAGAAGVAGIRMFRL